MVGRWRSESLGFELAVFLAPPLMFSSLLSHSLATAASCNSPVMKYSECITKSGIGVKDSVKASRIRMHCHGPSVPAGAMHKPPIPFP